MPMWKRIVLSQYLVLWLCLAYFLSMVPLVPGWTSAASLLTLLAAMLPLLIVAVGLTLVLIVAGIDLSITAVVAMASVVGAIIMSGDVGYLAGSPLAAPVAVAAMLATGAAIGVVNGLSVAFLRMPALLVTLASMLFFSGAAIWLTAGHTAASSIANLPPAFTAINWEWGRVPIPGLLCAGLVAVAAHLLLARTAYGRWLYAIGMNRRAAQVSGVPVRGCVVGVFLLSGLCAALTSVVLTARMETGSPTLWPTFRLLDVIGAVVIGGTSLYGGKGRVLGTVFGVLFLVQVDQSLSMLGLPDATVRMSKGGVILLAAVVDSARTRLETSR